VGARKIKRRQPARALRDLEGLLRLLVSHVQDYAIFMLDPKGYIISWNEGAERIKGYSEAEIVGHHMSRFYAPEDVERGQPQHLFKVAEDEGRVEDEGWRVRKDGTRFWADVVITALRDDSGQLRGFGKVTRDLTGRREVELTLRTLTGRLMSAQDEERRKISRELHDNTSPVIAALISKLYSGRKQVRPGNTPLMETMGECITLAEDLSTALRTVSYLLHPPLLDESGLAPSLRLFLHGFSSRTGARIETDFAAAVPRLHPDSEIALFRFAQECLAIFHRHSQRSAIRVRLDVREGLIALDMLDEERRLPAEVVAHLCAGRATDPGDGLTGMRARLLQLGGRLDVRLTPDQRLVMTGMLPRHTPAH
jgi:PAS domain S-box-containing protein